MADSIRQTMPWRRLIGILACLGLAGMWACASSAGRGPAGGGPFSVSILGRKGTPWTIQCLELQGPNRTERISRIAETLKRTPGIRPEDVYVLHDEDGLSRLYYGKYFRRIDRKTGQHRTPELLREDLDFIRGLGAGPGELFFFYARIVRMPTPDVGDPSWALQNVDALYSLQVAVFEPTEHFWQFKEAAAQHCKMLRDKGFEAYYHHTDACSMVTVGAFNEEALIYRPRGAPLLSPAVTELQQSHELLKYNLLNGAIYRVPNNEGEMVRMPSKLVEIPKKERAGQW